MLLGVDVVQEDEARRPAVEDRELIEDVQDAGEGGAWKTLNRHPQDVGVAHHRRDGRDELSPQDGVQVHWDRGQRDRVIVARDAEVEVLKETVEDDRSALIVRDLLDAEPLDSEDVVERTLDLLTG